MLGAFTVESRQRQGAKTSLIGLMNLDFATSVHCLETSISPTTYPSVYVLGDIFDIVAFLFIVTGLCLFSWLCLPCRRTLLRNLITEPTPSVLRYAEGSGLIIELLGIFLLICGSILFDSIIWIVIAVLFLPLWGISAYCFYVRTEEYYISDKDAQDDSHNNEISPLL